MTMTAPYSRWLTCVSVLAAADSRILKCGRVGRTTGAPFLVESHPLPLWQRITSVSPLKSAGGGADAGKRRDSPLSKVYRTGWKGTSWMGTSGKGTSWMLNLSSVNNIFRPLLFAMIFTLVKPHICVSAIFVPNHIPEQKYLKTAPALGYVCCCKIHLVPFSILSIFAFVWMRMCLISWFPAGRRLKETLMRSLLLPQDYLKDRGGEELLLAWIKTRSHIWKWCWVSIWQSYAQ